MTKISKLDWEIINSRVVRAKKDSRLKTLSEGLLAVTLDQIFPNAYNELHEIITDGQDDQGVDAVYILEKETSAEIYLFQAKYREEHSNCGKTINDNEVIKISHFINQIFDFSDALTNHKNFKLSQCVKRIWDLNKNGKICRYKVIFTSNGKGLSESAQKICNALEESHHQVSYEFYGGPQIIRGMSIEGRSKEDGVLQIVGKEVFERADGDVRGLIASIDAASFIDLITSSDTGTIKRHIFDDNLRVFLGEKGGFNPAIIGTATSDDSYLFWYLNNGITITCQNYSYNKGQTNPTLRFEDFQIVNGAQTSHSLLEAKRLSDDNLSNVVLMVRVYATDRKDIVERVAVATNSQARIQSRDLKANNAILVKLEIALKEKGYFFERKRNMYVNEPSERRIDALKLGQIIISYELKEPEKAKSESDSIFDNRFETIFHDRINVDKLIRLIDLYSIIEVRRDEFLKETNLTLEGKDESQFLVYGHWFILFACRLLIVKNGLTEIPKGKEAFKLVTDAIHLVSGTYKDQKSVAHYQIFRSSKAKDRLISELTAKQLDFFVNLTNSD